MHFKGFFFFFLAVHRLAACKLCLVEHLLTNTCSMKIVNCVIRNNKNNNSYASNNVNRNSGNFVFTRFTNVQKRNAS